MVAVPGAMAGAIAGAIAGTTSGLPSDIVGSASLDGVIGTGTEIDAGVVITGNGRLRVGLTVGKAGAKGLEVSHSQSGMSTVE
jgi:hypothetical protein